MSTKLATTIDGLVVETPVERDSIEVTRDAKGAHKFVVKLYFDSQTKGADVKALALAKAIHDKLLKSIGA